MSAMQRQMAQKLVSDLTVSLPIAFHEESRRDRHTGANSKIQRAAWLGTSGSSAESIMPLITWGSANPPAILFLV
jgi:hypothetical protein